MSLLSLTSYTDLLEKCRYELDSLVSVEAHPDYDFTLFNIVLGLNHLFEWYLKDKGLGPDSKINCIKKFNPFSSPYDVSGDLRGYYRGIESFPDVNRFQEMIRKLCNKAKHFKQSKIETQGKHYTAVCGSPSMRCGSPTAVCGHYDHYIYTVDIDGTEINLEVIISSLVEEWEGFSKSLH